MAMPFVQHPLIQAETIEARAYQEGIAARVLEKGNSLVVAPTALGKTVVAALVAARVLEKAENNRIIFLAPTKPLAVQHETSFKKFLAIHENDIALLTGSVKNSERENAWKSARVICATPQTLENDLVSGRAPLEDVGLIIFDEAHRAVKDYAYTFIAKQFMKRAAKPMVLGLTASPGGDEERIKEVCKNLFIENVEIKQHRDEDVKPYVKDIEFERILVDLPPAYRHIQNALEVFMKECLQFLKKCGYARTMSSKYFGRRQLLEIQAQIRRDLTMRAQQRPQAYTAASRVAALLKIAHAHTLLETQGIKPVNAYFQRLAREAQRGSSSKALKAILANDGIQAAMQQTKALAEKGFDHPKVQRLTELLGEQFRDNKDSRVIVFNHYRESAAFLTEEIGRVEGIRPLRFVGQATKEGDLGMTQKRQKQALEEFREGAYNVLVATSVAEEGLDIPAVDLVVFFEAVPSEIRTIQRRGRTGRLNAGRAVVLIARGTRDEAFHYAAAAKERRMHSTLYRLQRENGRAGNGFGLDGGATGTGEGSVRLVPRDAFALDSGATGTPFGGAQNAAVQTSLPRQETLTKFVAGMQDKVLIYVDTREQASSVAKHLADQGALISVKQLEVGDYVLADQIVVERKTVEDFLNSMLDGRLFNQLVKMSENYDMPLVLVEGSYDELFSLRDIHRNAIIGTLTSIALNYRTPVLFTRDALETAEYLFLTAKREQLKEKGEIRLRVGRKGLTLAEQQRFIVESLPMVGPTLAQNLLEKFGSVEEIVGASEKELQETEKLGPKKAKMIREVLSKKFKSD